MAKMSNGPAMDHAVSDDKSTMAKIIGTFPASDEEEITQKRFDIFLFDLSIPSVSSVVDFFFTMNNIVY
jgi:hypothetical protein